MVPRLNAVPFKMHRRQYMLGCAGTMLLPQHMLFAEEAKPMRVAVIGHTGRGNYGHGLDTMWSLLPQTKVVAVADPDARGLQSAMQRLQIENGLTDYRQMLAESQPDIVAICPRHPDQHLEMSLAAIEAGARGLYLEKPFCRSPAEADTILAAAAKHNVKIAVAHRNRYLPELPRVKAWMDQGRVGQILEIRGRGKGDHRGGVEDLWVLGSHVLNLFHYLGGSPQSCSAILRQDDRPVTFADLRPCNEGLGPCAGNRLHARYQLSSGVVAYFDSIANDQTQAQGFGLQIIGSEGVIDLKCDQFPFAHYKLGNPFDVQAIPQPWKPLLADEAEPIEMHQAAFRQVMNHVVPGQNLIDAILADREPLCHAEEAAMTVQMVCAVFASHLQAGREVLFPLAERENALTLR